MTSTRLKLLAVLEDVNDIREPELKRVGTTFRVSFGEVMSARRMRSNDDSSRLRPYSL